MKNYLLGAILSLCVSLSYSQNPTVTNVGPSSAVGNTNVILVGTNFTGATSVILRSGVDVLLPFTVVNPTTILVTVNLGPSKYINGRGGAKFIVTNASGANTTSPNFTYSVVASACNDIMYSDWSTCGTNGKQTRTFLLSPTGCTTKPPKDSVERSCEKVNVRHFQYSPNDTSIGIISNVAGVLDIKNSAKQIVESYSYNAGSNTISLSDLPIGEYVATTGGKFINIINKFQVVIESSDINNLVVKGKFGTAPYTYSINSTTNYTSSLSTVMLKNTYVVRCKDATNKVVLLNVKNTYANCTLTTTTPTYDRGFGVIDDLDSDTSTPKFVDYSEDYMVALAATTNNTTTSRTTSKTKGGGDRTIPSCLITAPANNATVGGVVSVVATATDNIGVTRVTLGIGSYTTPLTITPSVSGSTYTFAWNTAGLANGIYVIYISAYDAAGNRNTQQRQVGVGVDPLADITPPSVTFGSGWYSGLVLQGSTTYAVTINATDNVGVTSVSLILDSTTTLGTDASLPYSINWNTTGAAAGLHYLKAVASDAKGNTSATTIVVNLDNTNTLFTSKITNPVADTSVIAGATLNINAACTAVNGIARVEFVLITTANSSGTVVATDLTAPYSFSWNTTGLGGATAGTANYYKIWARAIDNSSNVMTYSPSYQRAINVYNQSIPATPTFPSVFNLIAPPVGNQGGEGSCGAWAQGYYQASTRYYYRNNMTSYSYSTNIFSPEYLYNYSQYISPANYGNCANGGSSVLDNNNILSTYGICTWAQMPYTSGTCTTLPNSTQFADAANHKFTNGYVMYNDTVAIKNLLITNHPVLFCVVVDDNFYHAGPGFIWRTLGPIIIASPHAVTCVGYDDSKHAFKVVNSWGTGWGSAGFIYIDYDLLVSGRLVASRLYYLN